MWQKVVISLGEPERFHPGQFSKFAKLPKVRAQAHFLPVFPGRRHNHKRIAPPPSLSKDRGLKNSEPKPLLEIKKELPDSDEVWWTRYLSSPHHLYEMRHNIDNYVESTSVYTRPIDRNLPSARIFVIGYIAIFILLNRVSIPRQSPDRVSSARQQISLQSVPDSALSNTDLFWWTLYLSKSSPHGGI